MFRQLPTNVDREAYELVKTAVPTAAAYPNTFAWYVLVQRFSDVARGTWAGPQAAAPKQAKAAAPKKEEAPKVEEAPKKAADDDEMDLFGSDNEEENVSIDSCLFSGAAY